MIKVLLKGVAVLIHRSLSKSIKGVFMRALFSIGLEMVRVKAAACMRSRTARQAKVRRLLMLELLEYRSLMAADLICYSEPLGLGVAPEGESNAPLDTWLDTSKIIGSIPFAPPRPFDPLNGTGSENGSGAGGNSGGAGSSELIPLQDTFKLHSRPTATKTIYLDFDGFTAIGTTWNASRGRDPIISPAYDPEGNGAAFSDNELRSIQTIWQRVVGDYAPFDVDVTTEDPGEQALVNTGGNDDRWGIRVVITPDDFPGPGSGGVAYIGSFRWGYNTPGATDTPCYVFNVDPAPAAAAISHEVGHSLGLSHDGTDGTNPYQQNAAYYFGHGGAAENGWGPIMGAPYGANVTTWDDGTYFGSNNGGSNANYGSGPDDIAVITGPLNGFGALKDDFGNSSATASALTGPTNASNRIVFAQMGTIERASDLDYFQFQAGSGTLDLTIDPYVTQVWTKNSDGSSNSSTESSLFDSSYWPNTQSTNLDVEAKLYDASGTLIATANPVGLRASFVGLQISAGVYTLSIDGVGFGTPTVNPPTGYSDYGSIGQYLISGSVPVAFGVSVSNSSVTYVEDTPPVPITNGARLIDLAPGDYSRSNLAIQIVAAAGWTDRLNLLPSPNGKLVRAGNSIFYEGARVGTLVPSPSDQMVISFNANTTPTSIESIVDSIYFEATGDAPDTKVRSIQLSISKDTFASTTLIQLNVQAVNDLPIAYPTAMDSIDEDRPSNAGTSVDGLITRGVIDPDLTTGQGIVITSAPISTGLWQYNTGSGWVNLENLSSTNAIILRSTTKLRFVPPKDFFGAAPELTYFALDSIYSGAFTSAAQPVFVDVNTLQAAGVVSLRASQIQQDVLPVNDPPVANLPFPSASVLQDQALRYVLPPSMFYDVDDTVLVYSASQGRGVILPPWLRFNSETRELVGTPRNQDVGEYSIIITARDKVGSSADAPVRLVVINVNDAPTGINLEGGKVRENSVGQPVGILSTRDPDPLDSFSWSVPMDPRFEVRGNVLYVAPGGKLDFEATPIVQVLIRTLDSGTPRLAFDEWKTIQVLDVNEYAPDLRPMTFGVSEGIAGGTAIGKIVAPDADTANLVRFRYAGTASPLFYLNADTGVLTLKSNKTLDYETVQSYQVFVEAYDDGVPSLATSASININVLDVNEYAPEVLTKTLSVLENQPVGKSFGRILATDRDRTPIRFSLAPSETRFSIDPASGELSSLKTGLLDYETQPLLVLNVIVEDSGTPPRSSQSQVSLVVLDANDPPTAAKVSNPIVTTNVAGQSLGTISIVDQDVGQSYTITSLDSRFVVNQGQLSMAAGAFLRGSDPIQFALPILVTETGSGNATYQLSIRLERTLSTTPWQNAINRFDVDRSLNVNPLDVLVLVDALNGKRAGKLPQPRLATTLDLPDYDVDGDGELTPLDVLNLVNQLNGQSLGGSNGEGESKTDSGISNSSLSDVSPAIWLSAFSQLEESDLILRKRSSNSPSRRDRVSS
jgi:hypothetical protein